MAILHALFGLLRISLNYEIQPPTNFANLFVPPTWFKLKAYKPNFARSCCTVLIDMVE
jgi:hypothetical protein